MGLWWLVVYLSSALWEGWEKGLGMRRYAAQFDAGYCLLGGLLALEFMNPLEYIFA